MASNKPSVGLFGLSGNPTHKGHMAAVRAAKEALGLDAIWLMINPFNPLKDPSIYAPYEHRFALAELELADSPDLHGYLEVSNFEREMRERGIPNESISTMREFEKDFPDIEPVWLMGADNLATMHRWGGDWNLIIEDYRIAVFSRASDNSAAETSITARAYREQQVDPQELLRAGRGHWSFIDSVSHSASSTDIRKEVWNEQMPDHISHASREYILQNGLYLPNQ